MRTSLDWRFRALALVALAASTFGFAPTSTEKTPADAFAPQLITVHTPTRADKGRLTQLGLDLTEHAGHDYVEAVLHTAADAQVLAAAGFAWDVRITDLVRREAEIVAANSAYAAQTERSELPSGRTTYRRLEDYESELQQLAAEYPQLAKHDTLDRRSLEGRDIDVLEIGSDVHEEESGRPVFAMFGLHHAREWPSGEHTIEFAYDLLQNYGTDERITEILDSARVIVVPVVNPDGFRQSVEQGLVVDLREVDEGGLVSILATPGNAYKRKNCRVADGVEPTPPGACDASASPGGFGTGVDLNRNYGGLWGGPGASDVLAHPAYRGAGPFSEPETQAVRELLSERHVTTLVTNHTYSDLILRPNGVAPDTVGPDGYPVGYAPDEDALRELGARMAAHNGYANIHGWELYDTTGTTEDWSYNTTGGYGYTFEIGPDEFHPPFEYVVSEYTGTGVKFEGEDNPYAEYEDKGGNREAYLVALDNTIDTAHHSVLAGTAPAGATLRLQRTSATPTWTGAIMDTIDTSMVVGSSGRFEWHVNPSTRPIVQARQYRVTSEEPTSTESSTATSPPPGGGRDDDIHHNDYDYILDQDVDLLEVKLDWPTPDDMDLYVFRGTTDGLEQVGSSTSFLDKERVLVSDAEGGDYVIRVVNYASVSPSYTVTVSHFETHTKSTPSLIEAYTLSCEIDGEVVHRTTVVIDRSEQAKVDPCGKTGNGKHRGNRR
ncbi:MAG: zinc carboxypeptidase [Actinobacteria bacterium]|nr:zinc carboxypeptidase [Actinomycetota bacterium]